MFNFIPMIRNGLCFLMLLLFFSCASKKLLKDRINPEVIPPNGLRIDSFKYIDRSEIRTVDWKEYVYWTLRVFGRESTEFRLTVPDSMVWKDLIDNDTFIINSYFKSPDFDDFPIVGITAAQAYKFSKWRADRVFEMMLIERGAFEPNTSSQSSDNYFSIEKYFKGEFMGINPDTTIHYFPVFRLPTLDEIKKVESMYQQSMLDYYGNCHTELCKDCLLKSQMLSASQIIDNNISVYNCPFKPAKEDCIDKTNFEIYHLYSNVGEMLSNGDVWGYRWDRVLADKDEALISINTGASASLGFRNICEWKTVDWNNIKDLRYY